MKHSVHNMLHACWLRHPLNGQLTIPRRQSLSIFAPAFAFKDIALARKSGLLSYGMNYIPT